jgi:hypothetical protein
MRLRECLVGWLPLSGACDFIVLSTTRFLSAKFEALLFQVYINISVSVSVSVDHHRFFFLLFFEITSLSLSVEAMMMLVIVLVECEIWGIVERV